MEEREFKNVWIRWETPSGERRYRFITYDEIISLVVSDGKLELFTKQGRVEIKKVIRMEYTTVGTDFINRWLKISPAEGISFYLADGRFLGWKRILAGKDEVCQAIISAFTPE